MLVKYLAPVDIPGVPADGNGWDELLFQALANCLRLKRTKMGIQDKLNFLKAWDDTHNKPYFNKKN